MVKYWASAIYCALFTVHPCSSNCKHGKTLLESVPEDTMKPIREAPAPTTQICGVCDESHPSVPEEPRLAVEQIQGNILGGFNKDHQTFLFFVVTNAPVFRRWLKVLAPQIATSEEVIAFNRLFKATRSRRKREGAVKATWINIAFTFAGLQFLKDNDAELAGLDLGFTDGAFVEGLAPRAPALNDIGEGAPENWLVGGTDQTLHGVIQIASDDACDLDAEATRLSGDLGANGAMITFVQAGNNLKGDLSGHEHFGFLDGVSQPGIRGRVSDADNDVLTPRQNPNERGQGKPGQDLLWPGEFVFGYPEQDPGKDIEEPSDDISNAGPDWSENGSYLVFRRLRQDVFKFHTFLQESAALKGVPAPTATAPDNASAAEAVGASLVGRWRSGAPIIRTPENNIQALGGDDCANNNFEFREETDPVFAVTPTDCSDNSTVNSFPQSPGDIPGDRCPFTAHIRKAYPRDDTSSSIPQVGERTTQTHRLLRRGIPFGTQSSSMPDGPLMDEPADGLGRGLLFFAYQTSIEDQFEFVTQVWVNNPDFKENNGIGGGGHDPIIGQSDTGTREFDITFPDGAGGSQRERLTTDQNWVIPTGGGYFFAPSIDALENLLAHTDP